MKNTIKQTSSRLLCSANNDKPLSKDLTDLFSALIVSLLPLGIHRIRFVQKVEESFLAEDAIRHLGNLKLLQSNRMPDPDDSSVTIISTSTTVFSMNKETARTLCQRFVDARFIESADGKKDQVFDPKSGVWKMTSKGTTVLDWFCQRNGIEHEQLQDLLSHITAPLIYLERDHKTDQPHVDRATIEVIFCRLIGVDGRGKKGPLMLAKAETVAGISLTHERKINGRTYHDTCTGQAIADWLLDYTTVTDLREAISIATHLVHYNLIESVTPDLPYATRFVSCKLFQPTAIAIYALSQRGQDLVDSNISSRASSGGKSDSTAAPRNASLADSKTHKLEKILLDPTLRLLFRENLREMHCEENLSFYEQMDEFTRDCKVAMQKLEESEKAEKPDKAAVSNANEVLSQSYLVFNTFLAPGSPREVNINHKLRSSLSERMTKVQASDATLAEMLKEVNSLFENAQSAVFKLMASDSVPKFLNNPKAEDRLIQAGVR